MKPKVNRKGKAQSSQNYDRCQTPFYAIDPLLPFLNPDWRIWEPAQGDGHIVAKLQQNDFEVIGSDILTGQNFFEWQPDDWNCQITNPPYSVKYLWLARSYQLQRRFALLLPLEALGAASGQKLFREYGLELILLDKRINFKMPQAGYSGSGAQFPVAWFTWGLNIGTDITYATISRYEDEQIPLLGLEA